MPTKPPPEVDKLTKKLWKTLKTEAGIPDTGSDGANVGAAIEEFAELRVAYQAALANLKRGSVVKEFVAPVKESYHQALDKLITAFVKFLKLKETHFVPAGKPTPLKVAIDRWKKQAVELRDALADPEQRVAQAVADTEERVAQAVADQDPTMAHNTERVRQVQELLARCASSARAFKARLPKAAEELAFKALPDALRGAGSDTVDGLGAKLGSYLAKLEAAAEKEAMKLRDALKAIKPWKPDEALARGTTVDGTSYRKLLEQQGQAEREIERLLLYLQGKEGLATEVWQIRQEFDKRVAAVRPAGGADGARPEAGRPAAEAAAVPPIAKNRQIVQAFDSLRADCEEFVRGKRLASISTKGFWPVEGVQKVRFSRAFSE